MSTVTYDIIEQLKKQAGQDPDLGLCESLVGSLTDELRSKRRPSNISAAAMEKVLMTFQKSVRAAKRGANKSDCGRWNAVLQKLDDVKNRMKDIVVKDETGGNDDESQFAKEGLPSSVGEYLSRLKKQNKELYKNPPVLPPGKITIFDSRCPPPKRDQHQRLVFDAGSNSSIHSLLKTFRPNQTPEEMLRGGSFGGTYFRSIKSAVTNHSYNGKAALVDTVPSEWIWGLDEKRMLTSANYDPSMNKYGVKCGGSLGMWESSGWISEVDPYGWFQWYCRFYQGRRCSDDARQISRWLKIAGPKGRFKSQLCNKIMSANARADDESISPVIRQTLFHWGLLITEDIVAAHRQSR